MSCECQQKHSANVRCTDRRFCIPEASWPYHFLCILIVCCMQNERDVIEVFSLQMPCIFKGILENEKVLRVIGTLFGSVPMGLSFARVSRPLTCSQCLLSVTFEIWDRRLNLCARCRCCCTTLSRIGLHLWHSPSQRSVALRLTSQSCADVSFRWATCGSCPDHVNTCASVHEEQFVDMRFSDTDAVLKEGELTLKLLNLFFDSVTKFQNMDTVLQPIFYELVSKTVHQLHVSKDKEGYLDLLLNLFRTIQVVLSYQCDALEEALCVTASISCLSSTSTKVT